MLVRISIFSTWLLIVVLIGRPFEAFNVLANFPIAQSVIIISVLAFVAGFRDFRRIRRKGKSSITKHLIAILLLAVVLMPFSVWKSQSLDFLLNQVSILIILFGLMVLTAHEFRTISFYVGGLCVAAVLLIIPAMLTPMTGRLSLSTSYDTNDLAAVVLSISPLIAWKAYAGKGLIRLAWAAIGIGGLYVVILTQSRGAFVALLTAISFFLIRLFSYKSPGSRGPGCGFIAVLILGVFLLGNLGWRVTPDDAKDRLGTIFSLSEDYNLDTRVEGGRIAIWQRGLDNIFERPWGHGLRTAGAVDGMSGGAYRTAHNSLLQISVELGVVAGVLFISAFVRTFLAPRLIQRDSTVAETESTEAVWSFPLFWETAIVAYVMTSLFLSLAYDYLAYAFFAVAASCQYVGQPARTEVKKESPKIEKYQIDDKTRVS